MAIYFIQNSKGNIKIGYAANPEKRLVNLQVANDDPLKLICVKKGNVAKEKELHHKFEKFHITREWFSPAPEIFDYINAEDEIEDAEYSILHELRLRIEILEKRLALKTAYEKTCEDIDFLDENAESVFKEGIQNAIKNNIRPSLNGIINRKPIFKKIPKEQMVSFIQKLIEKDEIYIVQKGKKQFYYLK